MSIDFQKSVFELLENYTETVNDTTSIAHEITELLQKTNVDGRTHDGIQ